MLQLDGLILERTEGFCHRFQRLTGLTNFWLARWCLVGYELFMAVLIADMHRRDPKQALSSLILSAMPFVIINLTALPFGWKILKDLDSYYEKSPSVAHPNSLRLRAMVPLRLLFLGSNACVAATLPFFLFDRWLGCLGAGMLMMSPASLYFAACLPLPPGMSRIRQFLESFRPMPLPVPGNS